MTQLMVWRHEDNVSHRIHCPICDQQMDIQRDPHVHGTVRATHHNPACPWDSVIFRTNPDTGYAEKATS